ncbi:RICIN domain-containing protein [Actinosynnema sp. NPDC047251]|uniref:Ricin B lectin domain-containing protein n=1 Tax=Saccharothrix espanaensis (strain ATCC 51144 / DSM 44229 / JCM 9112 / NBRC 15066 / NRRL 15764) TaxID=1179773 RepID=K0JVN2_SACES|nr:RICIN domain-containing protein [Saccharothrix espanaensis]CCH31920.1 hypothetical protein BN6_46400 [Saccharothrix espanaensis DSM 44229]
MSKLFRLLVALTAGLAALVAVGGTAHADGNRVLSSVLDGRCLDVYAGGAGPWVQVWGCNGQPNQKFFLVLYHDTETYEIRTSDYWCVDGRWGKGASLERAQCTGHPGQRWQLDLASPGYVVKSVQYPGLVWDVHGFGSGTKVQLWDRQYSGERRHQSWYITNV